MNGNDQVFAGRVAVKDARPLLMANERALTTSYCDRFPGGERLHIRNQRFAKLGVDLFQLMLRGDYPDFYTSPFWTDEGEYGDETARAYHASLDNQALEILKVNSNAVFAVAFWTAPPQKWVARYPDHMQQGANSKQYRAASYASDLWLEGQMEFTRRVVKFVASRSWGNRAIGYVVIPHTEGLTEASVHGDAFDQSPVMRAAYQQYVRKKYQTGAALQAAWHDAHAALETVRAPTLAEWNRDRAQWLNWTAPSQTQRYLDYFALQRDLLGRFVARITGTIKEAALRSVFVTVDAFKQPLSGWLIRDAFEARGDGSEFPDVLLASGSYDVGLFLDIPALDGLMTPADYTARSVGWGFEPEGIADSLVLRGKTMMLEDDARSWISDDFKLEQGAWRNSQEGRAGLLRNFALAASRGFFPHWANVGGGYFDDDAVMQLIAEVVPLRQQMMQAPLPPTEHAIAMIIDDESSLDTDFTSGFQQLAVIQQRAHCLALTGIPYRIYLLSDLAHDDFPPFRAYLFPNLFRVTPARIRLLREKVLRDGRIAIFGPATGVSDGEKLSSLPATELLGFPLDFVEKKAARRVLVQVGAHPALRDVPHPCVYGDSYSYGPILQPAYDLADSGAVELGRASVYWRANSAGVVLREFGQGVKGRGQDDYAVVFSMAIPIPAAVLRSLAIYGGCNPWSDLGDVVFASGNFLAVHGVKPGVRTLHLPQPMKVVDLVTGKVVGQKARTVAIKLAAPETRVFRLAAMP
ncbi:MAG: beta-galactosidase [Lentisphaerae bacterium]|nr:beta-galactosidase [Lentisphaerota bacterium]